MTFLSAVVAFVIAITAVPTAVPLPQGDAPALQHFNDAVDRYVALRTRLQREVPALRVTDESAEINNRSDMLAAAVERARGAAPQGEFFDAAAARIIRARLSEALDGGSVAALLARINDEPILHRPPAVHLRYPAGLSLATMPANLLEVLPKIPRGLEYRFAGRALILRDRDAALILDYLPEALPK